MDIEKKYLSKVLANVGNWAFLAGMTLAVLTGLYIGYNHSTINKYVASLLILTGLIVGLINITQKETIPFITAVISIFLLRVLGGDFLDTVEIFGPYIYSLLTTMMILFIPAMMIVALKIIWDFAVDV